MIDFHALQRIANNANALFQRFLSPVIRPSVLNLPHSSGSNESCLVQTIGKLTHWIAGANDRINRLLLSTDGPTQLNSNSL
jgi:hypothetical protein